jgi:hypothetical protein
MIRGTVHRALARRIGIGLAVGVATLPALAGPLVAHAATTATCATLTAVLAAAASGDDVILSDPTPPCALSNLTLPADITLEGGDANQGFDGGASGTRILTGSATGTYTIKNLLFQNGSVSPSGNGGAIDLTSPTDVQILNNRFLDNSAPAGSAGALRVIQSFGGGVMAITGNTFGTSGHGNSASIDSGALLVNGFGDETISNNTFTDNALTSATASSNGGGGMTDLFNPQVSGSVMTVSGNTFTNNSAHSDGGGASIGVFAPSGIDTHLTLTSNTFRGNHLIDVGAPFVTHLGGGLVLQPSQQTGATTQSHNVFDGNIVGAPRPANDATFDYGGGGEWISGGTTTTSLDDTFINNVVQTTASSTATGVGGGLAVRGESKTQGAKVLATNLVSGGNTVGTGGQGAGIYAGGFGCFGAVCPAEVDLNDSTVVGNTSGGTGGGIEGDVTDTLKLANDIVMDNTGTGDSLTGFGTLQTTYTDACQGTAPYAGTSNTCAEPKLTNVTPGSIDVHETSASPTIDDGLNSLVTAGVGQDYFGAARIQGVAVDMGAAEFTPVVPVLPAAGAGPGAPPTGIALWLLVLAAFAVAGAALSLRRRTG